MAEWLFPTLSEILELSNDRPPTEVDDTADLTLPKQFTWGKRSIAAQHLRAEREWFGAIAAVETLLSQFQPTSFQSASEATPAEPTCLGFILSGPLPILSHPSLLANFATWSFTADPLATFLGLPLQLLPSPAATHSANPTNGSLSLLPGDPLAAEPFCLIMTRSFSLAMVLGETETGEPMFSFSFVPEVIDRVWQALRLRLILMNPAQLKSLDHLYQTFPAIAPDYQLVTQFSLALVRHLPDSTGEIASSTFPSNPANQPAVFPQQNSQKFDLTREDTVEDIEESLNAFQPLSGIDVELLQAIAHEVKTPLTTIRTLTRSLLKRQDLAPDILKRLELIDRECSEQIDRFGLIFRAVEIETSTTKLTPESLASTSLAQLFEQSIPRWQKQATQRNLTLEVILPPHLPPVMSDPIMLDQALTSLIERSARSLPAGSCIQVSVSLAGDQLKLQLQSQIDLEDSFYRTFDCPESQAKPRSPLLKSLGQLLMFQPETGSLSLKLSVTKNIFQALGAKLIVRERPEQGEIFTLFLPLESTRDRRDRQAP